MKSTKEGRSDMRKKQLVNLPEDHKAWIARVVQLATEAGQETTQTEVLRIIVGKAMQENPESFVIRLEKAKLKARIDDIERRSAALEREKAEITEQLSAAKSQPSPQTANNAR